MLDQRELATVLAALRYWRHRHLREFPDNDERALLEEIATDAGTVESLTTEETEQLCRRLNANTFRA